MLEVLSPGAYATIQDLGRRGYRRLGVPWSGALDPVMLRVANALLGRAEGAPAIEAFDGGLHLAARNGPVRLAVAGAVELERLGGDGVQRERPWRVLVLEADENLRIRRMAGGRLAVVAVAGLTCPTVLGSAATYPRAELGGWEGRPLRSGAQLALMPVTGAMAWRRCGAPGRVRGPIRVVFGPQDDYFSSGTRAAFLANEYRIGKEADRMGIRLEGPPLAHLGPSEILSDAIVPGAIQVPGNGQPMVLLADAQTAGGYPKIATVIGVDLPRLADLPMGSPLRFAEVSVAEATDLARQAEAGVRSFIAGLGEGMPAGWDESALYGANLVGGVIDAFRPGQDGS
ncbi:MAG: biotin-dependent carboxyltransferase family protein [Zoogloeaceae bacterium]|nr:biotin-dependent carboxyltransferase family protein [Zoogloeaceae bacterium]